MSRAPQPAARLGPLASPPKPNLLDRARQAIHAPHHSRRTEEAYVHRIKRLIFSHGVRHPAEMGEREVRQFLSDLAVNKKASASTQNQALNALLFLYQHVLNHPIGWVGAVVRAKRPKRLPVVLTRQEVKAILAQLEGVPLMVCAGAGLRLSEALRIRVKERTLCETRLSFAMARVKRIGSPCSRLLLRSNCFNIWSKFDACTKPA